MTGLLIFAGIILFFVLLLSIPVVLDLEYIDLFKFRVSWLFIKFNIFPQDENKKKNKKKKEPKPKEKAPQKNNTEQKPQEALPEKKDNFIKTFYNNQGVIGIIDLIRNCASYLGKFSMGFLKSIYISKLFINISVTESDAAKTALKYGKICQEVYPPLGFICSSCHVKNYKVNIWADYCGDKTKGAFETKIKIVPRSIINAAIALVFRLGIQLLKVVFSNIKSSKNKNSNMKGGQ